MFDFLVGRGKGEAGSAELEGLREAVPQARPALGLALGGGAARGFAHIGVIRSLTAHGLVPDVIAGTSIGALAGALYATGNLDKFEQWSRALSRRSVFGYLDFSFSGSGLIRGNRLAERLAEAVGGALIEELPLRFAAIATEVGTGHEIWLTRGKLVEALRGSYALPGIFMPVLIGRRWLVDGALVNPVPVSAARALGARVVIAVNLNADLFGRGTTIATPDDADDWLPPVKNGVEGAAERLVKRQMLGVAGRPGISTVMMEAFNIMQDRITRARLAGEPPDVMVSPRLARISPFDFHRATEAIEIGAEAAEKAIGQIREAIAALT